jgi:hypothetical protein
VLACQGRRCAAGARTQPAGANGGGGLTPAVTHAAATLLLRVSCRCSTHLCPPARAAQLGGRLPTQPHRASLA